MNLSAMELSSLWPAIGAFCTFSGLLWGGYKYLQAQIQKVDDKYAAEIKALYTANANFIRRDEMQEHLKRVENSVTDLARRFENFTNILLQRKLFDGNS